MYLKELKLTNFKNYAAEHFLFSPKLNCIVGENGMGKTNLLDAIHYLCMCKSHFLVPDKAITQYDTSFFRMEGLFEKAQVQDKIVCKYQLRKPKVFEKNKIEYQKLSEHIGQYPLIMVCPDDSILLSGGSENRRQFINVLLVQLDAAYLIHLIQYNKVLKQRNAFLKNVGHPSEIDVDLLQIYNQQLEAPAVYIYQKRKDYLERLQPLFAKYYRLISGDREVVHFDYFSPLSDENIAVLLAESQEKDIWLQRTTKGIHKDDMKLFIGEYLLKKNASQGQMKSYLLALKLAQYALLKQLSADLPILLLDDIFDKLDKNRVENLLELLLDIEFGQIFITDTHPNRLSSLLSTKEYNKFIIIEGTSKPL